jgi:hypothetical protein
MVCRYALPRDKRQTGEQCIIKSFILHSSYDVIVLIKVGELEVDYTCGSHRRDGKFV